MGKPRVEEDTMLQKIFKDEVRASLCGNFTISLTLRFHVKSNFTEFKWSKNVIIGNCRGSEF